MYNESIENSIIGYFDGRLSDAESAELLHRVSVSPEIRQVFRAHASMRNMVGTAIAGVSVRPEVEEALFSKINALAAAEAPVLVSPSSTAPARSFFRRRAAVAALLLLLPIGLVAYDLFDRNASNGLSTHGASGVGAPSSETVAATQTEPAATNIGATDAPHTESVTNSNVTNETTDAASTSKAITSATSAQLRQSSSLSAIRSEATISKVSGSRVQSDVIVDEPSTAMVAIQPINPHSMLYEIGGNQPTTFESLRSPLTSDASPAAFEFSLESSTGFVYPASAASIEPFSDIRAALFYALTPNNLIGLRLTSGLFEMQGSVQRSSLMGMDLVSRGLERQRAFSEEIVYTHREFLPLRQLILLDASLSAGLIPNGNTIGAEIGVKLPLFDRVLMGFSFGLTRVHNNVQIGSELLDGMGLSSAPVLYDISNVRNTLNGRLQYGLSLQF